MVLLFSLVYNAVILNGRSMLKMNLIPMNHIIFFLSLYHIGTCTECRYSVIAYRILCLQTKRTKKAGIVGKYGEYLK